MTIKQKIVSTIVISQFFLYIIFGIIIVHFSKINLENEFFIQLEHRAQISKKEIPNKNSSSENEYSYKFKEFVLNLPKEEKIILEYDSMSIEYVKNNKLYTLPIKFVTDLLDNQKATFSDSNLNQSFGKIINVDNKKIAVIVSATNESAIAKLHYLKRILFIGIFATTIIILIVSYLLAQSILAPIKRKILNAMKISSTNLHQRIEVENPKDEIGQLAIAFNRMLDRLEESFTLQSSFISNASHEIKNPLTMISGTAEITLLRDRTNEEYKKALESIMQDSDFLNSLVKELFSLAKTDVNYEKLPKESFTINDILDLLNDNNKRLYPKKIKIIISNSAQNTLLYGNRSLLVTALQNLIDNAIKFSKNKDVIIEAQKEFEQLQILITDNGPGVNESEIRKITDTFFRSESVRNIAGHGIGLALAKKIFELHNGTLNFKNRNITTGLIAIIKLPYYT